MRCIFCKNVSDASVSVEHILPESLGNRALYLSVGVVCDNCNNYLSREVEKPMLQSGVFRLIRSERRVPSRRGKIPIFGDTERPELPNFRVTGRFVGKVGLEVLADRVKGISGWNDEIVNKTELDELRHFVRFNVGETWPLSYRTIYPVNSVFKDDQKSFEVLHEYDLLYTDTFELYIILVLFGVEFAMNLGGRVLNGYRTWLELHEWASPLYTARNLEQPIIHYFGDARNRR